MNLFPHTHVRTLYGFQINPFMLAMQEAPESHSRRSHVLAVFLGMLACSAVSIHWTVVNSSGMELSRLSFSESLGW